jgi:hypothetical protein
VEFQTHEIASRPVRALRVIAICTNFNQDKASSFFCPKRTLWSTTLENIRATIAS